MSLPEYDLSIPRDPQNLERLWQSLDTGFVPLACGYPVYKAWCDSIKSVKDEDPIVLHGTDKEGHTLFLLPLVKKSYGPFTVLTRPAMKHLAYYKGLFTPKFAKQINAHNTHAFWQDILTKVDGIDALWIDGLCEPAARKGHPMSYLDHITSSNPCHMMHLEEDWDAQYQQLVSAKKRSNDRRMVRLIEEHGSFSFRVAEILEDKISMLHRMLGQKETYFAETGQHDPFEAADIRQFYSNMMRVDHETGTHNFIIAGIYAGEEMLATILGGRQGAVFHGLIISRTMGPLAKYSPGRLLLLEMNKYLSEIGVRIHNFGTGDFDYKHGFCDEVMDRRHVFFPVTTKGKVFIAILKKLAHMKKLIKQGNYQHHPVIGKVRSAVGF